MQIDYRIGGSPAEESSVIDRIRLQPEWPVVDTVLLGPDDAIRRFARQMKLGFAIVYIVAAAGLLALGSAASPIDRQRLGWLVPTALVAMALIAPLAYRRNLRRFRERIEPARLPAPAGSAMRVSEAGLSLAGGPPLSWSQWSGATADLLSVADRSGAFYVVERLSLAAPGASITLLWDNSTNGRAFIDSAFRRLRAAAWGPCLPRQC